MVANFICTSPFITFILAILKLLGIINISWWHVLAPVLAGYVLWSILVNIRVSVDQYRKKKLTKRG